MTIKVKLDEGAILPTKAHRADAGYDIYAREDLNLPGIKTEVVFDREEIYATRTHIGCVSHDTGVHIEIPEGYVGFLKSKSGLNVNHGLTSEGVIDSGYTGSIVVKLYNNTSENYCVKKGDKISQLVILPIASPTLEVVEELAETERGNGGFGSTGR